MEASHVEFTWPRSTAVTFLLRDGRSSRVTIGELLDRWENHDIAAKNDTGPPETGGLREKIRGLDGMFLLPQRCGYMILVRMRKLGHGLFEGFFPQILHGPQRNGFWEDVIRGLVDEFRTLVHLHSRDGTSVRWIAVPPKKKSEVEIRVGVSIGPGERGYFVVGGNP